MSDLKKPGETLPATKQTFGVKAGSFASRAITSDIPTEPPAHLENPEFIDGASMENRIALMLDHSGSMSGEGIKNLRIAAQSFVDNCDFDNTGVAIETFPLDEVRVPLTCNKQLLDISIPQMSATGGTPMAETMEHVLYNVTLTRGVLVSDGDADNPGYAIECAKKYKEADIKIDTVHIGINSHGEETLRMIAEITGGIFIKFKDASTFGKSFKYLTPKFYAMLNAPGAAKLLGADEVK